jgi:hypothetical protein
MTAVKVFLKKRWLGRAIKASLFLGVGWSFYEQTLGKSNAAELWQAFRTQTAEGNTAWIILAIILLPLTYQIEAKKWAVAIAKIVQPTYTQILKSILAGTALSFWTPGQIGDYGGRLLFLETSKKWEVALATGVGNITQQLAIINLGGVGVAYYLYWYSNLDAITLWVIIGLYLFVMTLNWLVCFRVEIVIPILKVLRIFNEKNEAALQTLSTFSAKDIWQLIGYGSLKLLVYSLQYYCFLQFFGIYGTFLTLYLLILADYAIQIVLPVPPFLRLILRGEVAIAIWGAFSQNEISILAASYGVFTLNVLLPSLVGLFFILNANILKSFSNDEKNDA